jgi:hypothetical protein
MDKVIAKEEEHLTNHIGRRSLLLASTMGVAAAAMLRTGIAHAAHPIESTGGESLDVSHKDKAAAPAALSVRF